MGAGVLWVALSSLAVGDLAYQEGVPSSLVAQGVRGILEVREDRQALGVLGQMAVVLGPS